jgi:acyl carrier protein
MKSLQIIGCLLLGCLACTFGCGQQKTPSSPVVPTAQRHSGSTTEKRICAMTAELLSVDRAKVSGQTSLADLGADELDFVELVMEIEEEFDVSIPDDTAESLLGSKDWQQGMKNVTLAKLAALVDERRKQPPAAK